MRKKVTGRTPQTEAAVDPGWLKLLGNLQDTPASVLEMLAIRRGSLELCDGLQRKLLAGLRRHPLLAARIERLRTNPGVGKCWR